MTSNQSPGPTGALDAAQWPRVPGYQLSQIIGEGAAGIVYEGFGPDSSRALAIKVLHPHLATDEQLRGRFLREAQILLTMNGPSVCPVLALGETESGLPYMVMPKIEGKKLSDVDKAALSAQAAVSLVCEILRALEDAHAAGVIHRDLKPDNVLVSLERVMVVDFGLSKIVRGNDEDNHAELTANGMIFGTPEYMAPEQARGEPTDHRCDVYAAGVILYELLCGQVPLRGPNAVMTLLQVTREVAPPLSSRITRADLTPGLEACVMRAIAKDRGARYESALAFRLALEHAIAPPVVPGFVPTRPLPRDEIETLPVPAPPVALAPDPMHDTHPSAPLQVTRSSQSHVPIVTTQPSLLAPVSAPLRPSAQAPPVVLALPPVSSTGRTPSYVSQSLRGAPRALSEKKRVALFWALLAVVAIALGVLLALRT